MVVLVELVEGLLAAFATGKFHQHVAGVIGKRVAVAVVKAENVFLNFLQGVGWTDLAVEFGLKGGDVELVDFWIVHFNITLKALNQTVSQGFQRHGFIGDFAKRHDGVLVVVPIDGQLAPAEMFRARWAANITNSNRIWNLDNAISTVTRAMKNFSKKSGDPSPKPVASPGNSNNIGKQTRPCRSTTSLYRAERLAKARQFRRRRFRSIPFRAKEIGTIVHAANILVGIHLEPD